MPGLPAAVAAVEDADEAPSGADGDVDCPAAAATFSREASADPAFAAAVLGLAVDGDVDGAEDEGATEAGADGAVDAVVALLFSVVPVGPAMSVPHMPTVSQRGPRDYGDYEVYGRSVGVGGGTYGAPQLAQIIR